MVNLPEDYIVEKFFQYAYRPKYNRYNNTYQASCPICREGKSFGKKRRCFYIPKNNNIFCHNCGWSSNPYTWVKKVAGIGDYEIIEDIKSFENIQSPTIVTESHTVLPTVEDIPPDAIDLFDQQQTGYYADNKIIQECLKFVKQRKIDQAVNKPKSVYVSLKDYTHKNRLIIPFYNDRGVVEFYQSRTVIPDNNKPKYLSKFNADKTLFGLNNLDQSLNVVFVFEGPINAMFCRNGIAVAGIQPGAQQFTQKQQEQFDRVLRWYRKIWVLDSQWLDDTSLEKTEKLLHAGEDVFIWPEKYGKNFKDFNDITMCYSINNISASFITDNVFDSLTALIKLAEIKKNR